MSRPTTIAQARKYRYRCWGGEPDGRAYREEYCIEEVSTGERGAIPRQCACKLRPGTPYCGVHRPGAKAERAAKRPPTRFEREMAELDRRDAIDRNLRCYKRALTVIANMFCGCAILTDCEHTVARKALAVKR
jgi:hypothetical protein